MSTTDNYLLEDLVEFEKQANSELVHLLKDGNPHVTKKDVEEKYGRGKTMIVRETLKNPDALARYRIDKQRHVSSPLSHIEIALTEDTEPPNWAALYANVSSIESGQSQASEYENAIEQFLTALVYPSLTNPQLQKRIHDGRKRIDITYTNVATSGFFYLA